MRLALILFLVLLLPASASAADISLSLGDAPEVQFGTAHHMSGRLVDGTTPLAGRPVELRGRAFPYDGEFKTLATATVVALGLVLAPACSSTTTPGGAGVSVTAPATLTAGTCATLRAFSVTRRIRS